MRDETIKRRMQRAGVAVACGVLWCAAALAQEPVKSEAVPQTGAQTQIAAVRPAEPTTGGMRKTTNVAPGSPEAKMFSFVDAPTPAEPTEAEPQEEERPGKSTDGSVKIHGHWVIEVKEKDGTLKDRREFENSYQGSFLMGALLGGVAVAGDPGILMANSSGVGGCGGALPYGCLISESASSGFGAVGSSDPSYCYRTALCFTGLTSVLTPTGGPTSWVLSATLEPTTAIGFDSVGTMLDWCSTQLGHIGATSVSPSACNSNSNEYFLNQHFTEATGPYEFLGWQFTGQTVSLVTVNPGEVVVITVTISFV